MLNDFCTLTGYSRYHARFILRNCGKRVVKMVRRKRVVFTVAQARNEGASRTAPPSATVAPCSWKRSKRLWALSDGLCGKRLKAFLSETLPHLQACGTLLEPWFRRRPERSCRSCQAISAATLDRLLAPTRREARLKGRSGTRPGSLLKHQIPIRTFAQWNETAPGFCEVDLVAHDGGAAFGEYCQTLTLTDIATGWTETASRPKQGRNACLCRPGADPRAAPVRPAGRGLRQRKRVHQRQPHPLLPQRAHHLHPKPALQEKRQLLRRAKEQLRRAPRGRLLPLRPARAADALERPLRASPALHATSSCR